MGAVGIIGIAVTALTGVLDPENSGNAIAYSLSGFANTTIWLIVLAFFIARGFIKTGLGSRIPFLFLRIDITYCSMILKIDFWLARCPYNPLLLSGI